MSDITADLSYIVVRLSHTNVQLSDKRNDIHTCMYENTELTYVSAHSARKPYIDVLLYTWIYVRKCYVRLFRTLLYVNTISDNGHFQANVSHHVIPHNV